MAQLLSTDRIQELQNSYPAQQERLAKSAAPEIKEATRDELYAQVKAAGITGMSQATKEEMADALANQQEDAPDSE